MARFARDCVNAMNRLIPGLGDELGEETRELGIRIGLHSGPVTAGVLRGDRARYQLFGDSMNTTARIETNGKKNAIHLSNDTAEILRASGKASWLLPREDKIVAKGKGEMTTWWLKLDGGYAATATASEYSCDVTEEEGNSEENQVFEV